MNFVVLAAAELEAAEAALWYEDRRPGLGDEFLDELDRAFERIQAAPGVCRALEGFPSTSRDVRRCLLRRFPYLVVFLRRPEEVVVLAVSHARRRPFYWLERLV